MQEGSGETELNYLDSFKSYCNSSDLGFLNSGGWGRWVGGCLGWSAIVYMSSGMFRGKESSNRIELSRLVQDLLNFGVLGSLRLWVWGGGWMGVGVVGGCPHTCAHACACTHMYARTRMHVKHDKFMQMAAPIGGIPGNSLWCHTHMCMCVHVCMCMCVHMCGGHPLTTPDPHPPTPAPPGGTPRISQNSIALELIEIFQFCLKIWNLWRLPHLWVGVWFGGWVGGLMGGIRSKH